MKDSQRKKGKGIPVIDHRYVDIFEGDVIDWEQFAPSASSLQEIEDGAEDFRDAQAFLADDNMQKEAEVSQFAEAILTVNRKPMSLVGREYLRPVYNVDEDYPKGSRNSLIMSGRQVEKTSHKHSKILMLDGSVSNLEDVTVGDQVVGLSKNMAHTEAGRVTWKSELYYKPCIKITTRQGHEVTIALTHPMRTWDSWTEGGDLYVKSRLAVVRKGGEFTGTSAVQDRIVMLAAYLVAEGDTGDNAVCGFTQGEGTVLDEFLSCVRYLGDDFRSYERRPGMWQIRFNMDSKLHGLTTEWGLQGVLSSEKQIPNFVWGLNRRQTALFLNRLWAGDGHASLQGSSYHLEYDSASEKLCRDVQRLLWKFGIPTSFRRWKPTLYKDTHRWAYKLRVETQPGALRFISDIGALGKTEDLPLLEVNENSNRDTFPIEIQDDIQDIYYSADSSGRIGPNSSGSLGSAGLRATLKYPPSRDKLRRYVNFFQSDDRYDRGKVESLAAHLSTDLFWDEILEIEEMGEQPCYDITVEGTDSFVADGFITHNSTTLAGKGIVLGAINPAFFTLTVQPRLEQVRVFSQQRFAPMCEDSEVLQKIWMSTKCLWQVTSREFKNRSFYNFRSCYYSADPVRGITANLLQIDEIQDIISDNIPVLEECQAHIDAEDRYNLYTGTPKTTSNTLNQRWKASCQFEWLVKCDGCKHDNYLDEKVIGLKHYICVRCGKQIHMRKGRWVPFRPSLIDDCWGFRISQMMVPFMTHADVFRKMEDPNRPRRIFFNEVLGLPFDEGELVLTEADIVKVCEERPMAEPKTMWKHQVALCAGIDHGTGAYTAVDPVTGISRQGARSARSQPSYTVVVFGGITGDGKFRVFRIIKFTGEMANLAKQPEIINAMVREWGATWIMSDWGFGAQTNQHLVTKHHWTRMENGEDPLILECQYVRSAKLVSFNKHSFRYMVDRNFAIEQTVDAIKNQQLLFFNWESMQQYVDDFTSIYVEYDTNLNRIKYDHILPDDCFHAVAYCYMAARQRIGQLVSTGVPNI